MRCLYCGKQLALFRRLTGNGEFCSDAHKQSYHEEYNQLALSRLIAAQAKTNEAKPNEPGPIAPFPPPQVPAVAEAPLQRTLPEPLSAPALNHRDEIREPAGQPVLAAPTEGSAPNPAGFVIRKPDPAPPLPIETVSFAGEPLELIAISMKPNWVPDVAQDREPGPAGSIATSLLPGPRGSEAVVELKAVPNKDFSTSQPVFSFSPQYREAAGFWLKPTRAVDLTEFISKNEAKPESESGFQAFRFAVMVFGAPEFEVIQELSIRNAGPSPATLATARVVLTEVEPRRPAAVKAKLAELAAATQAASQFVSPKEVEIMAPPVQSAPGPEGKRRTIPIPSILNIVAEQTEDDPAKSIWGVLRKYMKK